MSKYVLGLISIAILFATAKAVTCPANEGDDPVYLPHETECGKFYECTAGKAVVLDCPPGLYFDAALDVCNWDVICGDLLTSTPPPPTTEGPVGPETTEPVTEPTVTEPPVTEPPAPDTTTAEA